jgi:hypothetical protein
VRKRQKRIENCKGKGIQNGSPSPVDWQVCADLRVCADSQVRGFTDSVDQITAKPLIQMKTYLGKTIAWNNALMVQKLNNSYRFTGS